MVAYVPYIPYRIRTVSQPPTCTSPMPVPVSHSSGELVSVLEVSGMLVHVAKYTAKCKDVVAEGPTSEKVPTSGIIPELGIQFPMSGNSSELLPDIGKRFPMSGNSFRYRKTVSDVGKQFPVSENGFRCRGTVPIPELLLDVGKPFPMSENDFRY